MQVCTPRTVLVQGLSLQLPCWWNLGEAKIGLGAPWRLSVQCWEWGICAPDDGQRNVWLVFPGHVSQKNCLCLWETGSAHLCSPWAKGRRREAEEWGAPPQTTSHIHTHCLYFFFLLRYSWFIMLISAVPQSDSYIFTHKKQFSSTWKWKLLSCVTLCDPLAYTVHGILQARILEWVAFPFSRWSSQPRDQTQVSWITGGFFTSWATREAHLVLHTYIFFHYGVFQDIEYSSLCYTIGSCLSILCTLVHIY